MVTMKEERPAALDAPAGEIALSPALARTLAEIEAAEAARQAPVRRAETGPAVRPYAYD